MKLSKSEAGKLGSLASIEAIKKRTKIRKDFYYKNPKQCMYCDNSISYELRVNKFCSKSCSASFNNTNNHWRGLKKPAPQCISCKNDITHEGSIYCSTKCHLEEKRKKRLSDYNAGIVSSQTAKNILIELFGKKCMQCGWAEINPVSNKCPIELEHSDGNSKNNSPSNLKLLCPNCHSLTPTYKALNKGNGRHSRMDRYRDGKSF